MGHAESTGFLGVTWKGLVRIERMDEWDELFLGDGFAQGGKVGYSLIII